MNKEIMNEDLVRSNIVKCGINQHKQQVAYSVHLNTATQVCFDCDVVRTAYNEQDKEKQVKTFDFITNTYGTIRIYFENKKYLWIEEDSYGITNKGFDLDKNKLAKFELTTMDKLKVGDLWCHIEYCNNCYVFFYIVKIENNTILSQFIDINNCLSTINTNISNLNVWRLIK